MNRPTATRPASRPPHRRRRAAPPLVALAAAAAVLAIAPGCALRRHYEPPVHPDTLEGTTFLHYLGSVPVVSFGEACRAMLLTADGIEDHTTHAERYAELRRRGVVRDAWGLEADHLLDRGTLGFMAFRICRLEGGVNTLLLGSWGLGDRRYALKEAAATGLLAYGVPEHAVAGGELLAVLARMDEHLARQGAYEWDRPEVDSPEDLTARSAPPTPE